MAVPEPTPSGVIRFAHTVAGMSFRSEYQYTGGPATTADLTALAAGARAAFATHLVGLLSSTNALTLTEASDLSQPSLPVGQDSTVVSGTHTSTPAPASVAALVQFIPNRKYRGSKPKVWLPFGTDADLGNDTSWSTGFVTAVNSAWAAYVAEVAALTAGTVTLTNQCAVSYYGPPTVANTGPGRNKTRSSTRTPPLIMAILSSSCRLTYGSQRRRLLV